MASLNRATIIGNVGKDPEIKTLNSGARVANLSIATSEKWKDKASGEQKERTEWHRVTIWNDGLVGVVERYVHKGSRLYIEGQLQTRKYEKDGADHYTTEIVLQGFGGQLIMLDGAKGNDEQEASGGGGSYESARTSTRSKTSFSADLDDEIPFATQHSIW